jgi:2-isopropylmalate synthase
MQDKIIIFDTTLRDGEQSPGASLNIQEKLEIAKQLEKLKVDVVEAGFPISSPQQFEAVKRIADEVDLIITALARTKEEDIKASADALKNAKRKRIHTFSSGSDQHILGKFGHERYGKSLSEKRKTIIKMSCDAIQLAKTFCDEVEFSAEDVGRADFGFIVELYEAAIEAGATTVNVPDTTGYTIPHEYAALIKRFKQQVKNINKAIISVHCHNDLGLAVANSLAAIQSGARQVECTINGIGERAGNASLEEIVMSIYLRKDIFNCYTGINTKEIYHTSKMVSALTGIIVQPNKAVVGENAFAHESGIHQDGVIKDRSTYEIMTPDIVGFPKSKIILGRHSGKHGLKVRLQELGYSLSDDELKKIYDRFIELADKKKEIFDEDLQVLMGDETFKIVEKYQLDYLQVNIGTQTIPTATIRIKVNDEMKQESATGDGPVDAVFNAIDRAVDIKLNIESYQVRSVTAGRQAMGEVIMRVKSENISFMSRGVSTDIIEASAKAYVHALNQYNNLMAKQKEIKQDTIHDRV